MSDRGVVRVQGEFYIAEDKSYEEADPILILLDTWTSDCSIADVPPRNPCLRVENSMAKDAFRT
jgi:hypothetical protein